MPIIPSNWTGSVAVNAIGIGGGSGSTSYAYANSLNATITELDTFIDLVGVCDEPISREVSLDLISGKIKLYWKGLDNSYTQIQIFTRQSGDALVFNTGYNFVDLTLGQLGLSIKCSELTEISLVLRWDKDIEFNIYNPPSPPLADNEISINSVINGSLAYQYFNGNIIEYHYELSNWDEMPIKLYTLVGAIPGQPINIVINQGTADRAQFSIIYYLNESDLSIPFTKSGSGEEWNWVISGKTNATLIPESNKFYKILVQDQFYSPGSFAIATGSPNVPTLPVVNIPDPTPTPTVTPVPTGVTTLSINGFWADSGGKNSDLPEMNKHFIFTNNISGIVTINLISPSIDNYMFLVQSNGTTVIDEDDDSGGTGYSKIVQTNLSPGNYIIVAATYNGGESGNFTLTVNGNVSNLIPIP